MLQLRKIFAVCILKNHVFVKGSGVTISMAGECMVQQSYHAKGDIGDDCRGRQEMGFTTCTEALLQEIEWDGETS